MGEVNKTSDEILNELFDSIHAIQVPSEPTSEPSSDDHVPKKQKKKKKKRSRSHEGDDEHKKKKKKHKSKRSKSEKLKKKKKESKRSRKIQKGQIDENGLIDVSLIKKEKIDSTDAHFQIADVFAEDLISNGENLEPLTDPTLEKGKIPIKITDLKNSQLLEIAEGPKKAKETEEGELTKSSDDSGLDDDAEYKSEHKTSNRRKSSDRKTTSSSKVNGHHRSKSKTDSSHGRRKSPESTTSRVKAAEGDRKSPSHKRKQTDSDSDERKRSKLEKPRDRSPRRSDDRRREDRSKSRDRRRAKDEKPRERRRSPRRRSRSPLHSKRRSSPIHRSRTKDEFYIDKSKLLEIARRNALSMLKQGQVGNDLNRVASITAGGKTVDELTDFCKLLSQKEATGQESISSESSSENEGEKPFHHPFQLKDKPNNIVMNIKNCAALPVKSHQEKTTEQAQQLRLQFPVSSGQHHRKTEGEWVPVVKKPEMKAIMPAPAQPPAYSLPAPPSPPKPPTLNIPLPPISPMPPSQNEYIGAIISERLAAIEKQHLLPRVSQFDQSLAYQTGLFTGSTGARVLTQAELASGQQAWAKKDQLMSAQPVSGGMGMSLLQKMGWKPGEGLGKNNEGTLEPLKLPVKMDKRGLVCAEEMRRRQRQNLCVPGKPPEVTMKSLEGKHPVSLLVEYCTRKHYPAPVFTVVSEEGPAHKKNFIFKVSVNGIDFQPTCPSPNKKQAKSEAATVCLRKLGILPVVQM